jgi:drug/metabolite transporter (DMT)-like permease
MSQSSSPSAPATWTGYLYMSVVYLVWGSTFLAIRLAVREGAGFPPFTLGSMRLMLSGGLLLAWAALRREFKASRRDLAVLAISGLGLWLGGNGLVLWAEQRIDSGYAALMIGSSPIWVAVVESLLDRRLPSALLAGSLFAGLAGLLVLTIPALATSERADATGILALLLAAVSWASTSVYQRRHPVRASSIASSGYQQFFAALGFIVVVLLVGEPAPTPTTEAWLAWAYLVLFGGIIAYTAFVMALRLLPTNIVLTHTFVNPVIAVFLGWLVLREPITLWTVGGALLVLLGVAGVFRDRQLQASQATQTQGDT